MPYISSLMCLKYAIYHVNCSFCIYTCTIITLTSDSIPLFPAPRVCKLAYYVQGKTGTRCMFLMYRLEAANIYLLMYIHVCTVYYVQHMHNQAHVHNIPTNHKPRIVVSIRWTSKYNAHLMLKYVYVGGSIQSAVCWHEHQNW